MGNVGRVLTAIKVHYPNLSSKVLNEILPRASALGRDHVMKLLDKSPHADTLCDMMIHVFAKGDIS